MTQESHHAADLNPTEDGPKQDIEGRSGASARPGGRHAMLTSIIVISVGAALGALLRWMFANWLNARFPSLPPGTLFANLLGGYLIGIALAVFATANLSPHWRLLTVTGFLGGLTTFSTFSAEVTTALLGGELSWAALTVLAHVLGSITMTLFGVFTVRLARLL
jgi:CrcB protein